MTFHAQCEFISGNLEAVVHFPAKDLPTLFEQVQAHLQSTFGHQKPDAVTLIIQGLPT